MIAWIPYNTCDSEVIILFVVEVKQLQHAHVFMRQPFLFVFFDGTMPFGSLSLVGLFIQLLLHELV